VGFESHSKKSVFSLAAHKLKWQTYCNFATAEPLQLHSNGQLQVSATGPTLLCSAHLKAASPELRLHQTLLDIAMSLTQQFHLLKRLCLAVDACFDCSSPPLHASATAAALRHVLKNVTEDLLNQRLKGRVFSFEALHLLLNATMGAQLLLQRCCHASQGFASASTAHVFIKIAPILYARIASAAAMMHVLVPKWDSNVQSSDFASQLSAIKATGDAAAADGSSARCQLLLDLLTRLHESHHSPIVPGELLSLGMVSALCYPPFVPLHAPAAIIIS